MRYRLALTAKRKSGGVSATQRATASGRARR
jgi:hypothetical protein